MMAKITDDRGSFNGRTRDFESLNQGPTPCPRIKINMVEPKKKRTASVNLRELWLEFTVYVDYNGMKIPMCGLCANTGKISTMTSAVSAAGVPCGIRAFCICPNGRAYKKQIEGSKYGGSSAL